MRAFIIETHETDIGSPYVILAKDDVSLEAVRHYVNNYVAKGKPFTLLERNVKTVLTTRLTSPSIEETPPNETRAPSTGGPGF